MQAIFQLFATLSDRPLGTVVHVGAGDGQRLQHYESFNPGRVVLIEGDPGTAASLKRAVGSCSWAEVHDCAVAPRRGSVPWHRYNLKALNGPLEAEALGAYYPRLQRTDLTTRDAVELSDLLVSLHLNRDPTHTNVLVFDVPGQEDALLASLSDELLIAFDSLMLHGCRTALQPGGTAAGQAVGQLVSRFYHPVSVEGGAEPLWPVALLRFDAPRSRNAQLEKRVHELEGLCDGYVLSVAQLQGQIETLTQARDELEARLSQTSDRYFNKAGRERHDFDAAGNEENQVSGGADPADPAPNLVDHEKQVEQLTRERDEQAHWHNENAKWARGLQAGNERLAAEVAEVRGARDELAKRLAEAEASRTALATQVDDFDARQRLLDNEILKAESQIELIKDILIREKNF